MEILRTNIQSKYIEMLKEYILKILKNEDCILFSMILDSAHEKFKNIHKDNLGYNLLSVTSTLNSSRSLLIFCTSDVVNSNLVDSISIRTNPFRNIKTRKPAIP